MKCMKCGYENPDNAIFCAACKSDLAIIPNTEAPRIPCGKITIVFIIGIVIAALLTYIVLISMH